MAMQQLTRHFEKVKFGAQSSKVRQSDRALQCLPYHSCAKVHLVYIQMKLK